MKKVCLVHWTSSPFEISGGGGLENIEKLIQNNLQASKLVLYAPKVIGKDTHVKQVLHVSFLKKFDPIYLILTSFFSFRKTVISFNYPFIAILKPRSSILIFQNYLIFRHQNVFFPLYTLLKKRYHQSQVVVCSKFFYHEFRLLYPEFPATNLHIIPNAVDILKHHQRYDSFHSPIRIVFAGQWTKEKGVTELIQACDLLDKNSIQFELHIIGGNLWNSKNSISIPKRKYIQHVGMISNQDTLKYFEEMDILIVPSKWDEPFGIVAIEGMLKGLIVITTGRGGLGDIVTHNKTGFIYKSDAIKLAKMIEHVKHLEQKAINRIRKNAYQNVIENYSQEKYIDSLDSVINLLN